MTRRWVTFPATALSLLVTLTSTTARPLESMAVIAMEAPDEAFAKEFEQAERALRQHQYSDAVRSYRRANDMRNGACAECLFGLARAYEALRAYKKVAETCDQLITVGGPTNSPFVAAAHNLKGLAIFNQAKAANDAKRFPEAEAAFRSALVANPNLHIARFNLGVAMLTDGDDANGIAELRAYLEKDPQGSAAKDAQRMIDNPRRARETFAPDFAFATMDGGYVSLDDLRGKVVMLDFWGTWCRPCVDSVGELKRIQKRYQNQPFVLISVSIHDTEDKWRKFVTEHQMTWPQYFDSSSEVGSTYRINAFPTYFVIDHEGIVRYETRGNSSSTTAQIEKAIDAALKKLKETTPK